MRKPILLATLSILLAANICNAQNGIINVFAAMGIALPYGITSDNAGNIYVANAYNGVVSKINAGGIITTIAGTGTMGYSGDGGPATAAQTLAQDVVTDALGNIYIADGGNHVIRKINTSGIITAIAGDFTSGVYSGDGGPATAARLGEAYGVALDAIGDVFFTDHVYNVVRKINTSGIITTVAGNGTQGYTGDGGPATAAQFHYPVGIKVDAAGNLYIADRGNHAIRKVNSAGVISTIAGNGIGGFSGDGGPATTAEINFPWNLAIGPAGDIYIADVNNYRVRKVNIAGIISTAVGNGTSTCTGYGGFPINAGTSPYDIAFDQLQNMYIANGGCNSIYKILPMPAIVSDSFSVYIDKLCSGLSITAVASSTSPLKLKVSYGDNFSSLSSLSASVSGSEFVNITHSYVYPGTYTIKMVLLNGTTPIDSVTYSYNYLLCNTFSVNFYNDTNGNCIKDNNETSNYFPITTEVDSNGIAVDTISTTSGFDYMAYGNTGDIYSFRILSVPPGIFVSCPSSGMIIDTLQPGAYYSATKNFALSYSVTSGFDLGEYGYTKCGRHQFEGDIVVNNTYNNPQVATFTAQINPKYHFVDAIPAPDFVAGNTVTWNMSGVSISSGQKHIHFTCEVPGTWLIPGDTVNSNYTVTPIIGDGNSGNNTRVKVDTVKSGYDPNEMSVTPGGYILPGAQLQYTIGFENTGNDTAHNIYVMDTLSSNVNPSSLRILASSAEMNIIPIRAGALNIIKFDFPNIQLLDSTHHNKCDGMVMFTINTFDGLPDGTAIFNHAGIFFDDNPVVMTNIVEDMISLINGSNTICFGVNDTLTELASGGIWSSSNTNATVSEGIITTISAGIDTISYTNTYANGPIITTKIITINPIPDAGTITGLSAVCEGSTIILSNGSMGGIWSAGNTNVLLSGNTATGITAGTSVISYEVTNTCGTAIVTHTVTVNPLPDAGTIIGSLTVCVEASTMLTDSSPGCIWTISNGNATFVSSMVTGVMPGTDTISYTVTNSGCSNITSQVITIDPLPDAGSISGTDSVCIGSSITLTETATGGTWFVGNSNASVSGGAVTGLAAGTDSVFYFVTNSCGTGTASTLVIIIACPTEAGTISQLKYSEIYPNPATDELTIKMDKNAYNSFTITNSVGQVFMQQQLATTQTTVNVKTLPAGLYYIALRGENGTKVQKFVKM